jgi:hypothetical protein
MRARRKEPSLLPSGCKADLTQRPVSSSSRPSWILLQIIQLPALIEAVDQHSKEPIVRRASRRGQIGATPGGGRSYGLCPAIGLGPIKVI